jgi:hypothetical protein
MLTEREKAFIVLMHCACDAARSNKKGRTFMYYRDAMAQRLRALPRERRRELLARAAAHYHRQHSP